MKSMLGAATDDGEWWSDKESKTDDLGQAVSFSVRVASDERKLPEVILCYGFQEDVNLERVTAEAERIVVAYKDKGGHVYGDLIPPTLDQWKSVQGVITSVRRVSEERRANMSSSDSEIRSIIMWCTGHIAMVERLIALSGGLDNLRRIIFSPEKNEVAKGESS
jgi:hypothetical protein